jgi:putative SOS response-associated peptidase YedK
MRLDVGAASCLPADITSGRNFLVAQNNPFTITRRNGQPIGFAGLWENAKEEHGTAAIVTTAASEETQEIHDRMPVILEKPDFARWLVSEPLAREEGVHGKADHPEHESHPERPR